MAKLSLDPERLDVVGIVMGTDVVFIVNFSDEPTLAGDTYAPTVTTCEGVQYVGTGTIDGTEVTCSWTDEQTTAMGAGRHSWKLWRIRSGLESVPVDGVFGVQE